ncbi:MAG: hypothetical protein R3C26_14650 [Calditrichia bacterium]
MSDDYGLATQLVFAWQQPQIPIFITGDLLFKHRLPEIITQFSKTGFKPICFERKPDKFSVEAEVDWLQRPIAPSA